MPRQKISTSGTTDTFTVYGGEVGLPSGLTLSGPMQAKQLADGRLFLVDLHPSVQARFYPDLVSWSPEETTNLSEPESPTPDDPDVKGE